MTEQHPDVVKGFHYSGTPGGQTLSGRKARRVFKAAGLPGRGFSQISKGESGRDLRVQQRDPGDGMVGYGIGQLTPNAWGEGTAAMKRFEQLGGIEGMRDPVNQLKMMRFLYKSAGNKFTPWYGTRFLTDRSEEGSIGKFDEQKIRSLLGGKRPQTGTSASVTPGRPGQTDVGLESYTVPGQSFKSERDAARRQLLTGGDLNFQKLLEYKSSINSLRDVPARKVSGDLTVTRTPGTPTQVTTRSGSKAGSGKLRSRKGGVHEVFYDPLGKYWDSGAEQSGGIGGHSDHVHVSADPDVILGAGRIAKRLGLNVGENVAFGGVDPVHTEGSFHYQTGKARGKTVSKAIDVSGDAAAMRKFARIMMRRAKK